MKTHPFIFSLLLLGSVSGAGAQSLPSSPLNLSVRKQTAPITDSVLPLIDTEAQATQATPVATVADDASTAVHLPYGAGFENRQQAGTAGNGNAGGSGNAGNGGKGRGGSGRGR